MIGIQCENPFALNSRIVNCKIPLVSMASESPLNDSYVGKLRDDIKSAVLTSAVDNDDISCPAQGLQRPTNIGRFVERQNYRRGEVKQFVVSRRQPRSLRIPAPSQRRYLPSRMNAQRAVGLSPPWKVPHLYFSGYS